MTEPEIPEEKNEQELNLFSDQHLPEGDVPAAPGSPDSGDSAAPPPPADPGIREQVPASAQNDEDAPVVAPPPKKKITPQQPGIVVPPRPGQSPFQQTASSAAPGNARKPLPPLQQNQTLGQMLAGIRSAREMTLEEVALITRIRMEYLTELEADELLMKLPAVYVSAYVRKLVEVYGVSREDTEILLEKMHDATPDNPDNIPEKLYESVNEGALINEGENKRIRNITIGIYAVLGIILLAIVWLVVLAIARYVRTPASGPAPAASGVVQPAETPSISVLKMSNTPGIRDTP